MSNSGFKKWINSKRLIENERLDWTYLHMMWCSYKPNFPILILWLSWGISDEAAAWQAWRIIFVPVTFWFDCVSLGLHCTGDVTFMNAAFRDIFLPKGSSLNSHGDNWRPTFVNALRVVSCLTQTGSRCLLRSQQGAQSPPLYLTEGPEVGGLRLTYHNKDCMKHSHRVQGAFLFQAVLPLSKNLNEWCNKMILLSHGIVFSSSTLGW
jgi:hypothetical protein